VSPGEHRGSFLCSRNSRWATLDFTADGAERPRGRRHRLVKHRVRGAGYAGLAIVSAGWTEANVEKVVGAPVEGWRELTADEVQALAAGRVLGRVDGR
jgi:hypothetical protein